MSIFSQYMKDVTQHLQRAAFAEFASRPSKVISVEHWLQLEVSERAPEGSVLLVEIQADHFTALVVDTATEQPLWRIAAPRALLAPLYDAMLGGSRTSQGSSLLLFAPRPSLEQSATPNRRGDPGKRG